MSSSSIRTGVWVPTAPGVIATDFFGPLYPDAGRQPGLYHITMTADDGARLYVNNILVLDNWNGPVGVPVSTDYYYPGGAVEVRVDYKSRRNTPTSRLIWVWSPGQAAAARVLSSPSPNSNGCTPVQGLWGYVNTGKLNFRTGPDVSYPV
ncbi:MAG: PA14 domain-containing protein [Chloroflexota bacterium]